MKAIRLLILFSLATLPIVSFATVDFLAANSVTKELYVFEDSQYMGIFWEAVAGEETLWQRQEKLLLAKGYTYTSNPYKLDYLFWSGMSVMAAGIFIIWFQRAGPGKKRNRYHQSK